MIECASSGGDSETDPGGCSTLSREPEGLSRDDFELFARQYAERLNAVAARFLRSSDDAADAVQDAFLSAYKARHRFQGQSTVYTWLYRIVVNACLMKVRSKRLKKNRVGRGGRSTFHDPEALADTSSKSASEIAEHEELSRALRTRIDQLRTDFRKVLLLRDIEELDIDEIAQRVGTSPDAVKTRIYRARQALRALLTATYPGA